MERAPLPIWSEHRARAVERPVVRRDGADAHPSMDSVVVEEPLELRLGTEPLLVTMRTPGDDLELALGLLYAEGVIGSMADVSSVEHLPGPGGESGNVVRVTPAEGRTLDAGRARRAFVATSACGLCGKDSLEAVLRRAPVIRDGTTVPRRVIAGLERTLREAQPVFLATGGLHAAGLFRPDGALLVAREDVGRHNAVDKVVGARLRVGALPLSGCVMFFSGRAGYEVVQKAALAGVPVVCSVGAATSLSVDLAREAGLTLAAFVRGERLSVYTHAWRITD